LAAIRWSVVRSALAPVCSATTLRRSFAADLTQCRGSGPGSEHQATGRRLRPGGFRLSACPVPGAKCSRRS
jgi:hypothetical protein